MLLDDETPQTPTPDDTQTATQTFVQCVQAHLYKGPQKSEICSGHCKANWRDTPHVHECDTCHESGW
jgi:hypothetical protein